VNTVEALISSHIPYYVICFYLFYESLNLRAKLLKIKSGLEIKNGD